MRCNAWNPISDIEDASAKERAKQKPIEPKNDSRERELELRPAVRAALRAGPGNNRAPPNHPPAGTAPACGPRAKGWLQTVDTCQQESRIANCLSDLRQSIPRPTGGRRPPAQLSRQKREDTK